MFLSGNKGLSFKDAILIGFLFHPGVPQGSVLGPILGLFVYDINENPSSHLFQFADDHTFYDTLDLLMIIKLCKMILIKFIFGLSRTRDPLYFSKCAVFYFSRSSGHSLFDYNLDGFKIKVIKDFNPCSPQGCCQTYFTKGFVATLWITNTEGHTRLIQ